MEGKIRKMIFPLMRFYIREKEKIEKINSVIMMFEIMKAI